MIDACRRLSACPDTDLVAVCDTDLARASAVGVSAFTEPAELLAQAAPEIVSVATPDATHAELLELCLRSDGVRAPGGEAAGARFTHRPPAVALARERGVVLAVNYTRRFARCSGLPSTRRRAGRCSTWAGRTSKGSRTTARTGSICSDAGGRAGGGARLGPAGEDGRGPDARRRADLAGGAGARLAALDTAAFTAFEMELMGTRGRLRIAGLRPLLERFEVADDPRHPGYRVLVEAERVQGALRDGTLNAVPDLVRCVRDGGEPACRGEDGVAALDLAAAIRASAARGGEFYAARHDAGALARAEAQVEAGDLDGARRPRKRSSPASRTTRVRATCSGSSRTRRAAWPTRSSSSRSPATTWTPRPTWRPWRPELQRAGAPPRSPTFTCTYDELRRGGLGPGLSPMLLGQLLAPRLGGELEQRINQLPVGHHRRRALVPEQLRRPPSGTASTTSSRTARCSAARRARSRIGMLANPRRNARRRCCTRTTGSTADRGLDVDDPSFERLIAAGLLQPATRAAT